MFAFGLPIRTVLALAVAESALLGALGTAAGVLLGVGAVALTPLLTARRLRRMNILATLRVVE
jgi:putative ABC transport system permease protein